MRIINATVNYGYEYLGNSGRYNELFSLHLVGKVIVLACDILTKIDAISFCIYCIFIYYLNFNQNKSIYH